MNVFLYVGFNTTLQMLVMFIYSLAYYFPTVVKYGFRGYRNATGKNLFHCIIRQLHTEFLDQDFCSVSMLKN